MSLDWNALFQLEIHLIMIIMEKAEWPERGWNDKVIDSVKNFEVTNWSQHSRNRSV